jgi:hypothetical protein
MESFRDVPVVRMNYTIPVHFIIDKSILYVHTNVGESLIPFPDI